MLHRSLRCRSPAPWLGACLLGLALAGPAAAQQPTGGTNKGPAIGTTYPPLTTGGTAATPPGAGAGGLAGQVQLPEEVEAALFLKALDTVDFLVSELGLTVSNEMDVLILVAIVYDAYRTQAIQQLLGGGAAGTGTTTGGR